VDVGAVPLGPPMQKFEHRHMSTIIEMQKFLLSQGILVDIMRIAWAWEEYSYSWAAGWMHCDLDKEEDQQTLVRVIKDSF